MQVVITTTTSNIAVLTYTAVVNLLVFSSYFLVTNKQNAPHSNAVVWLGEGEGLQLVLRL